jgi:uncharacterized membrane protein YcaP (DUF421 family)
MWHSFKGVDTHVLWDHLFHSEALVVEKVLRTIGVYFLLLILLRITGKRGLAGLNSLDLVVIFLLSNVVQDAVIGDDHSIWGGAIGAVTLVATNAAVNRLALKYPWAERLLIGPSVPVIIDGKPDWPVLRRYGLGADELDHAVRLQSGESIHDVEHGELTPTGQLILNLKDSEQGATRGDIDRVLIRLADLESRLPVRR